MTTLVALHVPEEGTWIGSDGILSADTGSQYPCSFKWVRRREWAIGIAGLARTLNIIEHMGDQIVAPEISTAWEISERIRAVLASDGIANAAQEESGVILMPNQIVIASPLGVWDICAAFSLVKIPPNMIVGRGSGGPFATGAGAALDNLAPAIRLDRALRIASRLDSNSGEPFYIEHLSLDMIPKKKTSKKKS